MRLNVTSEIGRLRRVLLHSPGREIDEMTPAMMERLLFEDILFGDDARLEHGTFRRILERAGAEVLDAEDLLAEAVAGEDGRHFLFSQLGDVYGVTPSVIGRLETLEGRELAEALLAGLRAPGGRTFDLDPVPNYFFQRDPQTVLGDRVVVAAMATDAREREALLARTLFEFAPTLAGSYAELFEIDAPPQSAGNPPRVHNLPTLEGGDVLVASPEVILIGISVRTNRGGVEQLAEYLRREQTGFRHLILVELPPRRSYMHLDTVFTLIDHGTCLAYQPVIEPVEGGHAPQSAYVYHVDLEAPQVAYGVRPSLRRALAGVGIDLDLVPCGGADLLDQDREQWTDGANAFAVAPGVIFLYARNHRTLDELDRRGWRVLDEIAAVSGAEPLLGVGPTVVALTGNELSRARGGPRCMTMPLVREEP